MSAKASSGEQFQQKKDKKKRKGKKDNYQRPSILFNTHFEMEVVLENVKVAQYLKLLETVCYIILFYKVCLKTVVL